VERSRTIRIEASAEAVWAVVGDIASLVPGGKTVERIEVEGSGAGATRTFHLPGGARVIERIETHDPRLRRYSYRIVDPGPLPFASYRGAAGIAPDGPGACLLTWSAVAEPAGVEAAALAMMIETNLAAALEAVASRIRPHP
jgi:carbon monoxide dehydrogenase subunit G